MTPLSLENRHGGILKGKIPVLATRYLLILFLYQILLTGYLINIHYTYLFKHNFTLLLLKFLQPTEFPHSEN